MMPSASAIFSGVVRLVERNRGVILPAAAASLILVLLVPLPPMLMDVLLAANIALAAIIMLTSIYVGSALEFSVFPSVLLVATLGRLVLNVATTRLILTAGAGGRPLAEAQLAAGHVVWSFSEFVTSGSLAVGVILFVIIVVVQFIVVTKGAGRISEVAARFVLDAMPGRQMAIDSDLSAGLISEDEARAMRRRIAQQADFYGAMDGASKFLRGDAIAGVVITLVNIFGGLYVGMVQYGWSLSETAELFSRLTIGDGLVTQIPAFIISISAALIVTRSSDKTNLGEEMVRQLASRPAVLAITAIFLAVLTLTSLPTMPLLLIGAGCAGLAWILHRRRGPVPQEQPSADRRAGHIPAQNVEELLAVDAMRIELGYGLVSMVDPSLDGDLLERIAGLRRQLAVELGLLVPPIRIRDNMRLDVHAYEISIRGAKVAGGKLYPKELLALAGSDVSGKVIGRETVEPAFSSAAVWISPSQKERAEAMNYTVVAPAGVLMTHLGETIRRHGPELLTRQQVSRLLENLAATAPDLVAEVTGKLETAQIQKVLQNLLRERVSILDTESILEALGEAAGNTDRIDELTDCVRSRLARTLSQRYCDETGKLWCVCIEEELEDQIAARIHRTGGGAAVAVEPEMAGEITQVVGDGIAELRRRGRQGVVVCAPAVRAALQKLIAPTMPDVAVLGHNEVDSVKVEAIASVGIGS